MNEEKIKTRPDTLDEAAAIAHEVFLTAPECVNEIAVQTWSGPLYFTRYAARRITSGFTIRQLEPVRQLEPFGEWK